MERRHYTPEQVVDVLREALHAIEEAGTPRHLEPIAFEQACRMVSGKVIEQALPAGLGLIQPPNRRG